MERWPRSFYFDAHGARSFQIGPAWSFVHDAVFQTMSIRVHNPESVNEQRSVIPAPPQPHHLSTMDLTGSGIENSCTDHLCCKFFFSKHPKSFFMWRKKNTCFSGPSPSLSGRNVIQEPCTEKEPGTKTGLTRQMFDDDASSSQEDNDVSLSSLSARKKFRKDKWNQIKVQCKYETPN